MGCRDCPYIGSVVVKNKGRRTDRVVIVGEAPGREEIESKEPFIGPTGRLLKSILAHTGIGDYALANSVRCFINKDDTKMVNAGMRECREYLTNFIRQVNPDITVVLGDIALRQVLGLRKITQNRGKFFDSEEFGKVFVTYHPAYLLRQGMKENFQAQMNEPMIKLYLNDFEKVKEYLTTGKVDTLSTSGYTELTKALHLAPNTKAVGTDYETTVAGGPHRKATVVLSTGISDAKGKASVWLHKTQDTPLSVKRILENPDIVKFVAARPFDEIVAKKVNVNMQNVHDVLTMAHIVNENLYKYSLETVTEIHGGMSGIKSLAEGMRMNLEDADPSVVVQYNGVDADAALRDGLSLTQQLRATPKLYRYYIKFMWPVQNMFSEICYNGCKIDVKALQANSDEAERQMEMYREAALAEIPNSIKQKYHDNLSLSRNNLIADYLFKHRDGLNLTPLITTAKTKEPAITEEHFKYLPQDIPFIDNYQQWKKLQKIRGTYLDTLWDEIHEDGRVYPSTLFTRTVTGRTVMLHPAIQTTPQRGAFAPLVKSVFVSDKGWTFGARDLAQSEFRIIGWLANDQNILGALRENIDLHTKTASVILQKPVSQVTKQERQRAKPVGFGFLYGMHANKFRAYAKAQYDTEYTESESIEFRRAFFARPTGYYMLQQYYANMIGEAQRNMFVESVLGRRRHLTKINSRDRMERGDAERQAINFPVQSFSSDLGLIGMMLFHKAVKENPRLNGKVKIMWFIHDSVIFQAKDSVFRLAMNTLKDCMENRAPQYIKENFGMVLGYPVSSDGKAGKSWATLEDYV